MSEFRKYVRTPHIRGSRFQHGDHDLEAIPWEALAGKHLVIEEKLDGANAGISFSKDGKMFLQSRGHYLRGGPREKHFSVFKQWASAKQEELFYILGSRYIVYGEWMYAAHTCFYDALPHYFMEFDVFDKQDNVWLATRSRARVLTGTAKPPRESVPGSLLVPVKVLAEGKFEKLSELEAFITKSHFITDNRKSNFLDACVVAGALPREGHFANKEIQDVLSRCDWDPKMEGLYVKWEEDSIVKGRYKFVRESFTNSTLDQDQHWLNRPIVQNKLIDGAYDNMFLNE